MNKKIIASLIFCLALAWSASAAAQDDGKPHASTHEPYSRTYYMSEDVTALRILAEEGDAIAQFKLGYIYDEGLGVPRNDGVASRWYKKSARQGNVAAQYNLGLNYTKGEGVRQDDLWAYIWFNLAAARGYENARKAIDIIADDMSQKDIARAREISKVLFEEINSARIDYENF